MTDILENVLKDEAVVKRGKRWRALHQDVLDMLPPDIVRELAGRRHGELKAAGYDVPDWPPAESGGCVKAVSGGARGEGR